MSDIGSFPALSIAIIAYTINNWLLSLILLHIVTFSFKGLGIHCPFALCEWHNGSLFFLTSTGLQCQGNIQEIVSTETVYMPQI